LCFPCECKGFTLFRPPLKRVKFMKINSLDDFLSLLDKVKSLHGNEYQARCPAHEDNNPSLSVTERNDRILVHCHAGCSTREILRALNLKDSDLFLDTGNKPTRSDIVETYDYTDEEGKLLFQVCRTEEKSFPQRRPVADGWEWGLGDTDRVLYRLPDVKDAINEGKTLFLVEGEKDANNLVKLGFKATCNPMGAGKWNKRYTDALKGARVVILPDNDEEGRKHAFHVAKAVSGKTESVRILELPDLPNKGDVSDWIQKVSLPEEQLKTLVKEKAIDASDFQKSFDLDQSNQKAKSRKGKRSGGRKAKYVKLTENIDLKDLSGPPSFPDSVLGNDPLGRYTKWTAENTETPGAFAFAAFKNQLGLAIGRSVQIEYGQTDHAPIFYDALIGKSAFSRKSTAIKAAHEIISKATSTDGEEDVFITIPGIGSAEGVLERIEGSVESIIGEYPKALIKLEELSVLTDRMNQKSTQSLISRFIELWDLPKRITNPTRSDPIKLERPTVSFLAGSTVENVKESFDDRTIMGGFYNRFSWWAADEDKRVPLPEGMSKQLENELIKDTKEVIELARDIGKRNGKITFTEDSKGLFSKWYNEFRDRVKGSDKKGAPIARTPEQVIRHALLFSLLEGEKQLTKTALLKGIEIGNYLRKSAYHVLERFSETATEKLKKRILKVLKESGGVKKRKLTQKAGPYYDDIGELNQLLRDMEELDLIEIEER